MSTETLYERLGGEAAIDAVVDEFRLDASLRAFDVSADDRGELLEAVAALEADVVSA